MKVLLFATPLVILVVGAIVLANQGTSVEVFPAETAEESAARSLESVGLDPEDWEFETVCLNMGACSVSVSSKKDPGTVLAINRYVVKDSKPSLNGPDRIADAGGLAP